jgi:hypothetical protein
MYLITQPGTPYSMVHIHYCMHTCMLILKQAFLHNTTVNDKIIPYFVNRLIFTIDNHKEILS